MKKIILFGSSAIDYIATSDQPLEYKVSNSGKLATAYGGVTRNVAHNLSKLGNKVTVVTALGKGEMANSLKKHYASLKVRVVDVPTKYPTSTYVAINDSNHDMEIAIFDNRAIKDVTPSYIKKISNIINQHDYIFIDGNVTQETTEYICKHFSHKKIFCDPIAPEFVPRFLNVLDKIYLMKLNIYEARALVNNQKLENPSDLQEFDPFQDEDLKKRLWKRFRNFRCRELIFLFRGDRSCSTSRAVSERS